MKSPQDLKNSPLDASSPALSLEEIVHIANKVGLEFVEAKRSAEYYVMMKPTIKAQIMLRIDDGKLTETRLARMAEVDPEYISFIEKLADAKRDADKLRVRYESYKNLFEARRSMLSYQKAELKLI
jgi:hypothetical protein